MSSDRPRQWASITAGSLRLRTWRRTRRATIASSRGPATGMNSGSRSMGDANPGDREAEPELRTAGDALVLDEASEEEQKIRGQDG